MRINFDNYNIHQKIRHARQQVSFAQNSWQANFVTPYSNAYDTAYKNYERTLAEDDRAEKRKAELAFMALALCSGSLLATAIAASIRGQIASVALKVICDNNMYRTFNFVHRVSNDPALKFVFAGAIGAVSNEFTSRIRAEVEANFRGNSELLLTEPWKMARTLDQYIIQSAGAIKRLLLDASNDITLSLRDRGLILKNVINSEFMRPPTRSPYAQNNDSSVFAKEMELSFYMKHILNSDSVKLKRQRPRALDVSPSDENYPKNIPGRRGFNQRINYDSLGQTIIDRINVLYREVMKTQKDFIESIWLGEDMNKDILVQAESVLAQIGKNSVRYKIQGEKLMHDARLEQLT